MSDIPLASLERLIKKAGAHRVSEDAKAKLREVLEEYAVQLGAKANTFAKHANRVTVTAEDIDLANK